MALVHGKPVQRGLFKDVWRVKQRPRSRGSYEEMRRVWGPGLPRIPKALGNIEGRVPSRGVSPQSRFFLQLPGLQAMSLLCFCQTAVWMILFLPIGARGQAENWTEFRGPTGQGHSREHGLPLTWSETENVNWKVSIPGKGWSSPVILGDQIWLTTAMDEGRSLRAICLNRQSRTLSRN